jgi:Zn-dependent metalloprotease
MIRSNMLLAAALTALTTTLGTAAWAAESSPSFLPPYMLEAIAKNGNAAQRAQAQRQMLQERAFLPGGESQLDAARRAPLLPRGIYSANNSQVLPGVLVWRGPPAPLPADKRVKEAAAGQAATINFFKFEINKTLPVPATVHFGFQYNNAFWNGRQMVFGDGDGFFFNPFTCCIDIVGHERQHGVTGNRLAYHKQSGALNESLSDVFGVLTVQYLKGQTAAQADWLVGKGLFTKRVKGRALRDMANPGTAYNDPVLGKDPQPADFAHYKNLPDDANHDNGGVHINSGIPNRAFVLFAKAVGGNAFDIPGHVWSAALNSSYPANVGFAAFAQITVDRAKQLYGTSVAAKLVQAWQTVGLGTHVRAQAEVAAAE